MNEYNIFLWFMKWTDFLIRCWTEWIKIMLATSEAFGWVPFLPYVTSFRLIPTCCSSQALLTAGTEAYSPAGQRHESMYTDWRLCIYAYYWDLPRNCNYQYTGQNSNWKLLTISEYFARADWSASCLVQSRLISIMSCARQLPMGACYCPWDGFTDWKALGLIVLSFYKQ